MEMEWISVKDRLPCPDDGRLLVVVRYYENSIPVTTVQIADFYTDLGYGWQMESYPKGKRWGITHWMPLPEPPEEETE